MLIFLESSAMELICIGDSLTFGYGVRSAQRWTNLAADSSGWSIVNMGLCGDTTAGMLLRLRTQVLNDGRFAAFSPNRPRIMLMGGCNDVFYSGDVSCARNNMGTMIQHLLSAGISPLVGIAMNFDPVMFPKKWSGIVDPVMAAKRLDEYHGWLLEYCRAFNVTDIVDFRLDFLLPGGEVDPALYIDGLHPNERGHRLMADRLLNVIGGK